MHARALALITASILAIVLAGLGYLHPFARGANRLAPATSSYQLAAVDFVNPNTGWVAATLDSGSFAVLRTGDAGSSWTTQLAGTTGLASALQGIPAIFQLMPRCPSLDVGDHGARCQMRWRMNADSTIALIEREGPANVWRLLSTISVSF
jgi:hypothetical protein